MIRPLALALALAATLPGAAQAVEYNQIQADKSRLAFGYKQMGVAMDGRFQRFAAQLRFDPAQPAAPSSGVVVVMPAGTSPSRPVATAASMVSWAINR